MCRRVATHASCAVSRRPIALRGTALRDTSSRGSLTASYGLGCGIAGAALSQALPSEPAALAAALPDVPRWIYARSLLLSGAARVRVGAVDAALILDPTTAVLVGRPDPELLRGVLTGDPRRPALLVQEDAWMGVRATLPAGPRGHLSCTACRGHTRQTPRRRPG